MSIMKTTISTSKKMMPIVIPGTVPLLNSKIKEEI